MEGTLWFKWNRGTVGAFKLDRARGRRGMRKKQRTRPRKVRPRWKTNVRLFPLICPLCIEENTLHSFSFLLSLHLIAICFRHLVCLSLVCKGSLLQSGYYREGNLSPFLSFWRSCRCLSYSHTLFSQYFLGIGFSINLLAKTATIIKYPI